MSRDEGVCIFADVLEDLRMYIDTGGTETL
jgi:hypothetical protein